MLFAKTTRPAWAVLWFSLSLVGFACSGPELPPMEPVSGTVTLDGKPLATGSVQFIPVGVSAGEALPATGMIDKTGNYELSTAGVSGAVVGRHQVRVVSLDEGVPGAPWLIPIRYNRPEESGLSAEVIAGKPNIIDLKLTSP